MKLISSNIPIAVRRAIRLFRHRRYNCPTMPQPLAAKFTLNDLRAARASGARHAMLTCYDFTTARLMQEAGVPILLVGDSAANVVLGHSSTLPVTLSLMIELTAAVRRGAPNALLMGDMPFGSFHRSQSQAIRNVVRMVQLSGCDCVKLEVASSHGELVRALADAGVAVIAHLGLRPQSVGVLGGYKAQGRTAESAQRIIELARQMQDCGAAGLLLEATPPQVAETLVAQTAIPVIGCGAGPACHAHVVVTHDLLGLTPQQPKFVPRLRVEPTATFSGVGPMLKDMFGRYVDDVAARRYPAAEHQYEMPADERELFLRSIGARNYVNFKGVVQQ
jgi:3-methyl-2-oxobutanoate hydroxymethyltransferase